MAMIGRLAALKLLSVGFMLLLAMPSNATTLNGTCRSWMTVTMEKNWKEACRRFPSSWKRFPSNKNCIVCHPDDWIPKQTRRNPPPPPSRGPDPALKSSWDRASCFDDYQKYVLSKPTPNTPNGIGAFIAGLNPNSNKYTCTKPLTYKVASTPSKWWQAYLDSCSKQVRPNVCRVLAQFRY